MSKNLIESLEEIAAQVGDQALEWSASALNAPEVFSRLADLVSSEVARELIHYISMRKI